MKKITTAAVLAFGVSTTGVLAEENLLNVSAAPKPSCDLFESIEYVGDGSRVMGRPVDEILADQAELGVSLEGDIPVAIMSYRFCGSEITVTEPFDRVQLFGHMTDPARPEHQLPAFRDAFRSLGSCDTQDGTEINWIRQSTGGPDIDSYIEQVCFPNEPAGV